ACHCIVPSPTPDSPVSVCSRVNRRLFHPCPTKKVSMRVILTGFFPFRSSLWNFLHRVSTEIYRIFARLDRMGLLTALSSRSGQLIGMTKNSSLSHRVTADLRRDIESGALEPGAWLKTESLAARYGVSANPVREALWRLQGEGYVVANPNQGARVRVVDDDFVRNIFEIREALEPLIIRRFCERATASDIARLREAAAVFAELASRKAPNFLALDG